MLFLLRMLISLRRKHDSRGLAGSASAAEVSWGEAREVAQGVQLPLRLLRLLQLQLRLLLPLRLPRGVHQLQLVLAPPPRVRQALQLPTKLLALAPPPRVRQALQLPTKLPALAPPPQVCQRPPREVVHERVWAGSHTCFVGAKRCTGRMRKRAHV